MCETLQRARELGVTLPRTNPEERTTLRDGECTLSRARSVQSKPNRDFTYI